jgi:hypothetical protein
VFGLARVSQDPQPYGDGSADLGGGTEFAQDRTGQDFLNEGIVPKDH